MLCSSVKLSQWPFSPMGIKRVPGNCQGNMWRFWEGHLSWIGILSKWKTSCLLTSTRGKSPATQALCREYGSPFMGRPPFCSTHLQNVTKGFEDRKKFRTELIVHTFNKLTYGIFYPLSSVMLIPPDNSLKHVLLHLNMQAITFHDLTELLRRNQYEFTLPRHF